MPTKCKFRCSSKTNNDNQSFDIRLEAVISGSPENDNFFKWTPSGSLIMQTINTDAAKQFEVGAEYYIDITPA